MQRTVNPDFRSKSHEERPLPNFRKVRKQFWNWGHLCWAERCVPEVPKRAVRLQEFGLIIWGAHSGIQETKLECFCWHHHEVEMTRKNTDRKQSMKWLMGHEGCPDESIGSTFDTFASANKIWQ